MNYEQMTLEELQSCAEQLRGWLKSSGHEAMKEEYYARLMKVESLMSKARRK